MAGIRRQAVAKAYAKSFEEISDVWMLRDPISYVFGVEKAFKLDKQINAGDFWITALTGLELFGSASVAGCSPLASKRC